MRLVKVARFYVHKGVEGFRSPSGGGAIGRKPGQSYYVLDRLNCHRIAARFNTEDFWGSYPTRILGHVEALARARAACRRLNKATR